MPEGPESQVIVDGLKNLTKDRWITDVSAVGGRYLSKNIPGLTKEFTDSSHPIDRIWRHGKAVVFDLATRNHIVVTLGMTGKFSLKKEKHAAVRFVYGDAHERNEFFFVDQRRFGTVRIIPADKLMSVLPKIGWDCLQEDIDVDRVKNRMKNLKQGSIIGSVLLDSSTFSGVGNYIRAEVLYESGISPWRRCDELNDEDIRKICESCQKISRRSYELGGNTIENFVDLAGSSGKFFEELKVYGKRKDPDGNEIIAEKTPEGRTMHWVPAKQF